MMRETGWVKPRHVESGTVIVPGDPVSTEFAWPTVDLGLVFASLANTPSEALESVKMQVRNTS